MSVTLHSTRLGKGPPVVLIHGLFGAGNNLGALARALSDRYTTYSLDLPDHGRSQWLQRTDLSLMADALRQWMLHHGVQAPVLVGHSLGGKVAMQFALSFPEEARALVVADIAPVKYEPGHDDVFAGLEAVSQSRCESRREAAARMEEHVREPEIIQFLLTNLQRGKDGGYAWRFNLPGLRKNYDALRDAPVSAGPCQDPVLFIRGGDSDYITERHRHTIMKLFPAAQMKVMPNCGHWLHAQHPRLFNGLVGRFLDRLG